MDIFKIGTGVRTEDVSLATPSGENVSITCKSVNLNVKSKIESIISKPEKRTTKDCTEVRWIALRYGVVDADSGEQLFNGNDRQRFGELESWFVEPLFEKILELSGVSEKDREDFEGN